MTPVDPTSLDLLDDDGPFDPTSPLNRDLALLDQYLMGELTEAESRDVQRRMVNDAEFGEHVEPIVALLGYMMLVDGYEPVEPLALTGPALPAAIAKLALPEPDRPVATAAPVETPWDRFWRASQHNFGRGTRRIWRGTVVIGRSLLYVFTAIGIVFVTFMLYNLKPLRTSITEHQHGRAVTSGIDPTKFENTRAGQTHLVTLDHGSTVTLGPGSRFSYRLGRSFGSSTATHQGALDGEALFKVTEPWLIVTAMGDAWLDPGVYAIQSDTSGTTFYMRVDEGSAYVWHNTEARPDSIPMRPGDRLKLTVNGVSLLLTSNQGNFPSLMPRQ